MNTLLQFLEIDLSQRMCLLAAAHTVAAKYPTVTITQSKTEPWAYDVRCLFSEFNRVDVPLEYLIPQVEDVVTMLMASHPEMLEMVQEAMAQFHPDEPKDKQEGQA